MTNSLPTLRSRVSSETAIEVAEVSFAYGERRALEGLTLSIPVGAIFGLLGPNGSGKSTLLSLVAGLRVPDTGSVLVMGEVPSSALRARIGVLFQESSLDPLMTVRETCWLHGRLYGMRSRVLSEKISAILDTIGLAGRSDDIVRTLSGGMKRRLEVGRALLTSPDLLLLDEPTTGLDPDSELAIWTHLADMNRDGVTVVVATNNVGEADRHCDTVAFIHDGRVVTKGTPAELKAGLRRDGVWVEGDFTQEIIEEIANWPDVGKLTWAQPTLHATVDSAPSFGPRLFQLAGDRITSLRLREATLEDAYFEIVGASLSDPERAS